MEMFLDLIMMEITQLNILVRTVHLEWVYFIVCKLYLSKVDFLKVYITEIEKNPEVHT